MHVRAGQVQAPATFMDKINFGEKKQEKWVKIGKVHFQKRSILSPTHERWQEIKHCSLLSWFRFSSIRLDIY